MNKDVIESIFLVLVIIGVFVFIYYLLFYDLVKRFLLRRSELRENSSSLAQEEPHPYRNLTPEEIDCLNMMIKSADSFSPLYILGFINILIYVFSNLDPRSTEAIKNYPFIIYLLIFVPALITFLVFYKNREKAKKMKLDLTSQVFLTKGKVYREEHRSKYGSDLWVTVRGIMFDGRQKLSTGAKLFEAVNQDQEVAVEYSPNSKYVWKINNTTNI